MPLCVGPFTYLSQSSGRKSVVWGFDLSVNSFCATVESDPVFGGVLAELGDIFALPGCGGTLPLRTALAEGPFGAFLPQ